MASARGFDTDWRESVGYLLRDATRLMLRMTAALIAEHGITMTQYFLLRQLWETDGQSQRELARQLDVPEPALATLLDALEAAGLVVRKRSTSDLGAARTFMLRRPEKRCASRCSPTVKPCSTECSRAARSDRSTICAARSKRSRRISRRCRASPKSRSTSPRSRCTRQCARIASRPGSWPTHVLRDALASTARST